MRLTLDDEQTLLREQVRKLCGQRATADVLRQLITERQPMSRDLWAEIGALGLTAAAVPEPFGGVGLGLGALCVIAEELGRAVAPVPFFSSACMATEAIKLAASVEQQRKWLPGLAGGEKIATLAYADGSGDPRLAPAGVRWSAGLLNGRKAPVADLGVCDWLVVIASDGKEPVLAVVDFSAAKPDIEPLNGFDELRHHGAAVFRDTPCELLTGRRGTAVVNELFCRLAVVAAFEQIGGAEAAMLMARDYTLDRYVFGRQLASYQAVKHRLADLLALLEVNRSNALYAAAAFDTDADGRCTAAATAHLGATSLYEQAARENLQLHGGIGFTWEANCHFHYRRARLLSRQLGGPEAWRRALIDGLRQQAAQPAQECVG